MELPRISVVGLGKLGSCLAACFAAKGFSVTGIDVNESLVESMGNGRAPYPETHLQDMLDQGRANLRTTSKFDEIINSTDITFLITPTPSETSGHFSDAYLCAALRDLASAFGKHQKRYHMFVITSTVSPGTCQRLIPFIEEHSGKQAGYNFSIAYNPEFIALGDVVNGILKPDFELIGESDQYIGTVLSRIYTAICENEVPIHRMSLISAEITKIALNSYVTMKISFSNTLLRICDALPGARVEDIIAALGQDKRISPSFLKAGPPFGGPCFPRDNRAFAAFADMHGVVTPLAKATDDANMVHFDYIVQRTVQELHTRNTHSLAVLGLSYKHGTPVIDESPAIALIQHILKTSPEIKITVYDRLAIDNARRVLGDTVAYAPSLKECLSQSDTCIVTTRDEEFAGLEEITNDKRIIDLWNPSSLRHTHAAESSRHD